MFLIEEIGYSIGYGEDLAPDWQCAALSWWVH